MPKYRLTIFRAKDLPGYRIGDTETLHIEIREAPNSNRASDAARSEWEAANPEVQGPLFIFREEVKE